MDTNNAMTISVQAELLAQARELPDFDGMSDDQIISLCLKAGLGAADREKAVKQLSTLLRSHPPAFSCLVLHFAQLMERVADVRELAHIIVRNERTPGLLSKLLTRALILEKLLYTA